MITAPINVRRIDIIEGGQAVFPEAADTMTGVYVNLHDVEAVLRGYARQMDYQEMHRDTNHYTGIEATLFEIRLQVRMAVAREFSNMADFFRGHR